MSEQVIGNLHYLAVVLTTTLCCLLIKIFGHVNRVFKAVSNKLLLAIVDVIVFNQLHGLYNRMPYNVTQNVLRTREQIIGML